jgi:inward rectifier potassium channel
VGYAATNAFFALAYLACGADSLVGTNAAAMGNHFWRAFFFSVETLATIGYGNVTPNGLPAHLVMTVESLVGLLAFALGTGILFSRFSRPMGAIVQRPRGGGAPSADCIHVSNANARSNQLVELRRRCCSAASRVRFARPELALERATVVFFPLSWTIVHPIDEKSPLFGMTEQELEAKEAEFMILLAGTDETFSQTVHARSSYKPHEISVGHRFVNIYNPIDENGVVSIDIRKLSETEPAPTMWSIRRPGITRHFRAIRRRGVQRPPVHGG